MALNGSATENNATGMLGHIFAKDNGINNAEHLSDMQINLQSSMPSEAGAIFICIYAAIFLLGGTGNAVVCWVLGKKEELSGSDVFMISLAFADLLASAFVPIKAIQDILGNLRWHLGPVMCEILASIPPISLAASSWSLVLIAADRHRIIVTPMKRRIPTRIRICGVIFIWVIAICMSLSFLIKQKRRYLQGEHFCLGLSSVVTLQQNKHCVISFTVIGWAIPISIVTALYSLCTRKLRENSFNNDNRDSMKRRILENKKVIKTFFIVATMYWICTLPYAVVLITIIYSDNDVGPNHLFLSFALSNINCCMNPFVYAIRQPEVKAFVKLKWRKLRCMAVRSELQHT